MAECLRTQIDPYLPSWIQFNSNLRLDTTNMVEEKVENSLEPIGTEKDILNITQVV